jgi:hypothetical protein
MVLTAPGARASDLTARYQFGVVYDDNPYEYSRSDLELFRQRVNPARFAIRTSDDLHLDMGGQLAWRYRAFGHHGSVTVRTRMHGFLSNWEKSYGSVGGELGQTVCDGGRLTASYTNLPNYLIRYYRNPATADTSDYAACRFAEHLAGARFRQQFGALTLEPRYAYEMDDYVAPFDHYDTKAHRVGGQVGFDLAANFEVRGDYEWKHATAKGPTPDASYDQHRGDVTIVTRPRSLRQFSVEAGYSLARRRYTTRNPGSVDPSHAGRSDNIEGAHVSLGYDLSQFTLRAGYDFEWRTVSSDYISQIEDIKDYRAGRLTLGVDVNPGKEKVRR